MRVPNTDGFDMFVSSVVVDKIPFVVTNPNFMMMCYDGRSFQKNRKILLQNFVCGRYQNDICRLKSGTLRDGTRVRGTEIDQKATPEK